MRPATHRGVRELVMHTALMAICLIMLYPIIWLFFAALKPNHEIYGSATLLPSVYKWDNFAKGWSVIRGVSFFRFFGNSLLLAMGVVLGSVFTSCTAGFAFARLNFKGKNFLFAVLVGTMLLPATVTLIPRYILFAKFGWVGSYWPFWAPAFTGAGVGGSFFIFLMVQYIRGLPRELDESAKIDGCGMFRILCQIIMPLCKPVMFSISVFAFMWCWDDFQNQLIFLNKVEHFTVALALRMVVDTSDLMDWGPVLAMSLVAIIPSLVIFFIAQKFLIEGIATTGLKG